MHVKIVQKYGPFKAQIVKRVVREGFDFFLLKAKGTCYHVPKYVCEVLGHVPA